MASDYCLSEETPSVEDYCRMRVTAGLSAPSEAAAQSGLPNTVAGAVIRQADRVVGMGRAVGDGLFYQIVDVAVDPAHQKRGLGKMIMSSLMQQLKQFAPAEAYVSLIADGAANRLYAQYGFAPTAPASIGMAQCIKRSPPSRQRLSCGALHERVSASGEH